MSTRKLRDSWWVDIRFNRRRYRKRSPKNTKAGAEAYESVLRQKLSRGEVMDCKDEKITIPTFKDFSQQWYETYVMIHNKSSECRTKRIVLNGRLIPFFGTKKLNEISSFMIERYKVATLKCGLSPKTVNNHLGILGKCLRDAKQWELIETVPIIKKLRVPPSRFDFLTPLEANQLLGSITDQFWHSMVLLALRTGLRLSELKGLRWEDIDLERRMLTVRRGVVRNVIDTPKSNRERHIPLTQQAVQSLNKRSLKISWVFSLKNNKHMQHGAPEKAIKRFCEDAGLRKIGWHTLRHTFASHLVARNVNIKAVQELLGHADIQTTMRYAHLAPSALKAAIDTLEQHEVVTLKNLETVSFGQQVGNAIVSLEQGVAVSHHFPA